MSMYTMQHAVIQALPSGIKNSAINTHENFNNI